MPQSDYSPLRVHRIAMRPRYDCGMNCGWWNIMENHAKYPLGVLDCTLICHLGERPTTRRRCAPSRYISLSRWRKWLLSSLGGALSRRGTFRTVWRKHETFGLMYLILLCRLVAAKLVSRLPRKIWPNVRPKETSPRSISTINRNFLLSRCSEYRGYGSRQVFSLAIATSAPCVFIQS